MTQTPDPSLNKDSDLKLSRRHFALMSLLGLGAAACSSGHGHGHYS